MEGLPPIIIDLALILMLAASVTLLFRRLKQPLILGYIVVGILAGPHFNLIPTVLDKGNVQTWADIGVIFLMFTLGLEFSIKKVMRLGGAPFIAACTIIFCMIGLGSVAGHFFGWSRINSLFLGGILAMSSTTIIYKALSDMGLQQQRFAQQVMSVLVVEDILGILLMVILSTLAASNSLEGMALAGSLLQLALVLVVWFVVGIFLIPTILRKVKHMMTSEMLLIFSLGLCFLMVVFAEKLGYSSAFGAFMMGSILAETIEADDISRIVGPVKDLFGAVFFVSVGMLVDPAVIAEYWLPILIITLIILVGQAVFGTAGYMLSGQPLKVAMQCGFSMAQIGEFAFIIASMGATMKVTDAYLYPVVVTVSVVTTFLTPYMIRLASPAYNTLARVLPKSVMGILGGNERTTAMSHSTAWRRLIGAIVRQVVAYSFLAVAVIILSLTFVRSFLDAAFGPRWGGLLCGVVTIAAISPFLRAIVMRKNHSDDWRALWHEHVYNRYPLVFTILVRYVLASAFVMYVLHAALDALIAPLGIAHTSLLLWCSALLLMFFIISSTVIKRGSINMEHRFLSNLNSRDLLAAERGARQPGYAASLIGHDVHLSLLTLPMSTRWAGKTLRNLSLTSTYGVMVAAIYRKGVFINIPGPDEMLHPGDTLQVIGGDQQLKTFAETVEANVHPPLQPDEEREVLLRSLTIKIDSEFLNKRVMDSRLRETYHCMLVGFDDNSESLSLPDPRRVIRENDILWIVGERRHLRQLLEQS